MRDREAAQHALDRAETSGGNDLVRSLWLAKAADYGIKDRASLVGGAAMNLHTGSYKPTDIDLCARLDESDRHALIELGFCNLRGDHFSYDFADGETWLVEFPDTQVDGAVDNVTLEEGHVLSVIRRESLIVDRVLQATDRTGFTFDEALRLFLALWETADWEVVEADIHTRSVLDPGLGLTETYQRLRTEASRRS